MPRNLDLTALTTLLMARLSAILPASVELRSHGTNFEIVVRGTVVGGGGIAWCLTNDCDPEESVRIAACSVLNTVQDEISIELKEPWPYAGNRRSASALAPIVDVQGGRLLLSYGAAGVSAVELAPVLLVDVGLESRG